MHGLIFAYSIRFSATPFVISDYCPEASSQEYSGTTDGNELPLHLHSAEFKLPTFVRRAGGAFPGVVQWVCLVLGVIMPLRGERLFCVRPTKSPAVSGEAGIERLTICYATNRRRRAARPRKAPPSRARVEAVSGTDVAGTPPTPTPKSAASRKLPYEAPPTETTAV